MKIDTGVGSVDLGSGCVIGTSTSHDAFRATGIGQASTPLVVKGPWRSYSLPRIDLNGTPFYVAVYFHEDRLDMIEVANASSTFGLSWSEWSPENEQRRREWHDLWLAGLGVRQGEYDWGSITSMTDPKSGGSSIVFKFKQHFPG